MQILQMMLVLRQFHTKHFLHLRSQQHAYRDFHSQIMHTHVYTLLLWVHMAVLTAFLMLPLICIFSVCFSFTLLRISLR